MDITDFNFTSANRVDQIAFHKEGQLTVPPKESGSTFSFASEDIPTGSDEIFYPSMMLVSKNNVDWYSVDALPANYGLMGGAAMRSGEVRVAVFVTGSFTGQLYYRVIGVYND